MMHEKEYVPKTIKWMEKRRDNRGFSGDEVGSWRTTEVLERTERHVHTARRKDEKGKRI